MVAISGCQGLWANNGNYRDVGNNQVGLCVHTHVLLKSVCLEITLHKLWDARFKPCAL